MKEKIENFILSWWAPGVCVFLLVDMVIHTRHNRNQCRMVAELRKDLDEVKRDVEHFRSYAICSIDADWEDNSAWIEITQ